MAAGDEHLEIPTGDINGINRDFFVSVAYETDSTGLFLNGLLVRAPDDDGWEEVPPTGIRTRNAPLVGDTLHVRYIEA